MNSGPNWARRYGPNHRRLCARPGCGAPAAATLRFQPTQREAWLVELEDDAARTEGDLCARHAAGLVLPRGWQLHNSLASAPTDVAKAAPPVRRPRGASIARARRRRSATSAVELPGLAAVNVVPDAGAVVSDEVSDNFVYMNLKDVVHPRPASGLDETTSSRREFTCSYCK